MTKTADALGKVTDPVNYTIEVCNTGIIPVTKTSVIDSLIPVRRRCVRCHVGPGCL